MRRAFPVWALLVAGCGSAPPESTPGGAEPRLRVALGDLPIPACTLPAGCPDDGLDPAWCIDDPSLLRPTVLAGRVIAVEPDVAAVAAAGLAPGTWHTAYPDAEGGCARIVTTFQVGPP